MQANCYKDRARKERATADVLRFFIRLFRRRNMCGINKAQKVDIRYSAANRYKIQDTLADLDVCVRVCMFIQEGVNALIATATSLLHFSYFDYFLWPGHAIKLFTMP